MRCAIVPHQGEWDEAGIEHIRAIRNEPLQYSLHANAALEQQSLLDVANSTHEVVAMYPTPQGIIVRLYNASGDEQPQRIKLSQKFNSIAEVDLNGNIIKEYQPKKLKGEQMQFNISMPRFGFKTLRLTCD
jgi:alpha-mannosidase